MAEAKKSFHERILAARLAIEGAREQAELVAVLAPYGYDAARLGAGLALVEALEDAQNRYRVAQGERAAATATFNARWDAARATYGQAVTLARVALRQEAGARETLGLKGRRALDIAGWLAQAGQFYTNALASPTLGEQLAAVGLTRARLEAGQLQIAEVEASRARQQQARGAARDAKGQRELAKLALAAWMGAFRAVARIALADRPGQLRGLGL